MKKIENSFAVTGFVANNAEIRQFTTSSVARFSLVISDRRKLVKNSLVFLHSLGVRHGVRMKTFKISIKLAKVLFLQWKGILNPKNGLIKKV